jgi:hypothetical protein
MFASLSYNSFERYIADSLVRGRWDHYMRIEAAENYNNKVEEVYKKENKAANESVSKDEGHQEVPQEPPDKDKPKRENAPGSSLISMKYLINAEFVEQHPEETELMMKVFERLIHFLYGNQIFFQNIIQARPNAIQEMIAQVRQVNQERTSPITKLDDITQLVPPDPQLYFLWYQLLRKNPVDLPVLEVLLQKPASEINLNETNGKISLFNYINSKPDPKLRVYLIPKGLLYAILQDREAVREVIQMRKNLHKEFSREAAAELKERFQNFSLQFPGMNEFLPILDFSVTSTSPNNYAAY